jgi:hypothetical protein
MWRENTDAPTRLDFALGDDDAEARKIGEQAAGRPIDFPAP